ncbi:hypothetical protein, partial [Chryseobacterium antibioticum]|uniref:hypothetical protein n=1 Tax=Chryseobacterium antibioticum TaxID=2728847 RepID=UPI001E5E5ADA
HSNNSFKYLNVRNLNIRIITFSYKFLSVAYPELRLIYDAFALADLQISISNHLYFLIFAD